MQPGFFLLRPLALLAAIVTIAACSADLGATATASLTPTADVSAPPSPSAQPTSTPAPTALTTPGPAIDVLACGSSSSMAAVCLGSSQGTLFNSVKRGANLELALTVTNPGSTPSPSITLVLFQFESGPWPFGAVSCPDCSAISQVPLAIEWRSLASGETRTLAATIVTSGAPGSYIWFADLYAQPLDAVKTLLTTVGTGTGLFDWKDQTTITAP